MDADDRERLEAYARSQNYFQGVAEDVVIEMLKIFIRRTLPWLVSKIREAVASAWDYIRSIW